MPGKKKSWEKRLSGVTDKLTIDSVESLSLDKRLYKYDIVGSIAHAQMLAEKKIISRKDLKKIKDSLIEISREIADGKFSFDKTQEDIHMAVESALIKKAGDAGKKLHTGRSRNDQVATDIRLWIRDEIDLLQARLTKLQQALVRLSEKYSADVMPGYTHLQRAQPVSTASYVLSFVEQFNRDYIRLANCSKLVNVSPLGSGALAGSTLPLDRRSTANKLGFADITYNSLDAVSDRDFAAEFIFDCSLIAAHLSRLAEDWIIYSSAEFEMIRIDDEYCTSSSMMPQKRNPDLMELIRSRTGNVYGSLMAVLTVLKAQPSTYNRDLQEDKRHIFSAGDTVEQSLEAAEAVVSHTSFNKKKISQALQSGFPEATALAEYLVKKGIPFREAHGIVASLVADCEKKNLKLRQLTLDQLKKYCPSIDPDVNEFLDASGIPGKYLTEGAAGPREAKKQIAYWKKTLAKR